MYAQMLVTSCLQLLSIDAMYGQEVCQIAHAEYKALTHCTRSGDVLHVPKPNHTHERVVASLRLTTLLQNGDAAVTVRYVRALHLHA